MDQNKINITIFVYIHCISNKYDNIYILVLLTIIRLNYVIMLIIIFRQTHSLINNIHW